MADESGPSMGDVLGNAGEPIIITANDRTYKLAYPTPKAIDRVEKLIAANYVAEIASLEDILPAEEFESLRKGMRSDLAARAHRAGGSMWSKIMSEASGQTLYLLGLFHHHHPQMTEAEVIAIRAAAPLECDAAIELVSPFFFGLLAIRMGKTPGQAQQEMEKYRERVAVRKLAGSNS